MKGVIWLNNLTLTDIPKPPIKQGEVLGKVVGASITHLEKLIALGAIPTDVGRVLGSVGVIKAIDVAPDLNSRLIGRHFLLLPRLNYVGGINFNGILAEYSSIPLKLLTPISDYYALKPETLIYAELSFIYEITNYVKNKEVLVVGCGPTSYIIVKHIKDLCNVCVACVHNQQIRSKIAELGVYIANYDNINDYKYDIVIVLTMNDYQLINALKAVRNNGRIIIPPNFPEALLGILGIDADVGVVNLIFPKHVVNEGIFEVLERDFTDLKNYVNFTNNFEEALSSMFHFWRTVIYGKSEDELPSKAG
ncbi:MAG: hypothetical protein N3G48_05410 [Sulfolobales archaeon]|nr:hypothetical protein [Sulfolobales archaeon]